VIIVTWNVRDYTLACLEALAAGDARHRDGSDRRRQRIERRHRRGGASGVSEDAHVLANDANVGFPIANNQALALARGEYVLFLNPDTEVGPGSIRACIAELDADAGLGMAGCRVLLEDGRIQPECARRPYLLRHLAAETAVPAHALPAQPPVRRSSHGLLGQAGQPGRGGDLRRVHAGTHARGSETLGGLPDDIFMYHEDLAFCLRVRRAGWRIRYLGEHVTLHRWRGSEQQERCKARRCSKGQYKLQLIRDAQGPVHAAAGRALFALRCASRLAIGGMGTLLFGRTRLAEKYPRVLDWRSHGLQLVWSVAPWVVADSVPRAPDVRRTGSDGREAAAGAMEVTR
jgi:GT2 family glycosyltransferase